MPKMKAFRRPMKFRSFGALPPDEMLPAEVKPVVAALVQARLDLEEAEDRAGRMARDVTRAEEDNAAAMRKAAKLGDKPPKKLADIGALVLERDFAKARVKALRKALKDADEAVWAAMAANADEVQRLAQEAHKRSQQRYSAAVAELVAARGEWRSTQFGISWAKQAADADDQTSRPPLEWLDIPGDEGTLRSGTVIDFDMSRVAAALRSEAGTR